MLPMCCALGFLVRVTCRDTNLIFYALWKCLRLTVIVVVIFEVSTTEIFFYPNKEWSLSAYAAGLATVTAYKISDSWKSAVPCSSKRKNRFEVLHRQSYVLLRTRWHLRFVGGIPTTLTVSSRPVLHRLNRNSLLISSEMKDRQKGILSRPFSKWLIPWKSKSFSLVLKRVTVRSSSLVVQICGGYSLWVVWCKHHHGTGHVPKEWLLILPRYAEWK